jgi:hypothetical protein
VSQLLASKDMNMEAVESTLLQAVTRQEAVKKMNGEDLVPARVNCKVCRFVKLF